MPSAHLLVLFLHIGAASVLLLAGAARLARPASAGAARTTEISSALLAALAMPLTDAGGWWPDMPFDQMVPLLAMLAAVLAASGSRGATGRLACFALASFFVVLGLASVRNGGPLPGFLAVKAMLFGLGLALLPWQGGVRIRMALLILLGGGGAALGLLQDVPIV